MTLKQHTIQAAIGSALLAPFLGIDTIIFSLSVILIDVDHYFDFVIVCRRFGIRDMFKFHSWVWHNRHALYGLSLFHTAEVFLLLFVLGFWSYYFWLILSGFIIHFIFDFYHLYVHNCIFNRAFSVVEYIIKGYGSKCYPLPEKDFWNSVN